MSTAAPPPDPVTPPVTSPRKLLRSRTDRVIGGVGGGVGRYFDIDPVIVRIVLAGLTFVGGLGVFMYVAALLFVPDEDGSAAPFERSRALTIAGAIALGIAALAVLNDGGLFFGPVLPIAVAGGLGYAIWRAVKREGGLPITFGRVVLWITVGAGAGLGLFALAFGAAWAAAEGSGVLVASVVIALGLALLLSALKPGGARWLAVPALAIAIPLGVVSAADVSFDGGFGERSYRPATVAAIPPGGYEIGAGELRVDLRDVVFPPGQETAVDVRVGTGRAEVVVPEGVCVLADSRIGGGYVNVRGRDQGGFDVDFAVRASAESAPRVRVRADVGFGALDVVDEPEEGYDRDRRFGNFEDDDAIEDGGCTRVEIASAG